MPSPPPAPPRRRWTLPLAALAALAAGCSDRDYPQTALHPRSDYARWIQQLLDMQVMWVAIIFVVVMGLLLYAAIRFRARPGAPDPKPIHGNTFLEVAWTIAPAVILALVAVPTVMTIYKTQGAPPPGSMRVEVTGHQWWWEFRYPDLGIVTANELHVPVNRTIAVDIKTMDVLHSFWFPAIGGKRDAIPNHVNHMWFTPSEVGTFPGQCAELCGISHANMRMKLMVDAAPTFDAWVAGQKAPPVQPDSTTLAGHGKAIFSKSACVACHTIDGVSAGIIGPNLTHVGSRTSIAGATYVNEPEHLGHWIANAPGMKPGSIMPQMTLPPDQISAIVAYLRSLK